MNKGSDMPQSTEQQMIWKTIIFAFCLLQRQTLDPSESTNVSHSKAQFLAEKKIDINTKFYIYVVIYKPF